MEKWLVIYDIRDEKRLVKTAKKLLGYGIRVQKSVFEIKANGKVMEKLRREILKIIDADVDQIVYFNLCEADWQKREKYGPEIYEEEEKQFYIF